MCLSLQKISKFVFLKIFLMRQNFFTYFLQSGFEASETRYKNCLLQQTSLIVLTLHILCGTRNAPEPANETLWTCEKFKLPWNQGCFENVSELFFFLIKVDFKLTWNQGKIHELPWNQSCFQNAPELFFEIKFKIHLDFRGEIHVLPWNQGCFQNVREPAFHNHYNSNKWSGHEMMGNWS